MTEPVVAVDIETGRLLSFEELADYERAPEGDWVSSSGQEYMAYRKGLER